MIKFKIKTKSRFINYCTPINYRLSSSSKGPFISTQLSLLLKTWRLSVTNIFNLFIVTHINIFTSVTSKVSSETSSLAYRTLCYLLNILLFIYFNIFIQKININYICIQFTTLNKKRFNTEASVFYFLVSLHFQLSNTTLLEL